MSEAYEKVKAGRLTFKGGGVASGSKSIDKNKKKKKNKQVVVDGGDDVAVDNNQIDTTGGGEEVYTIDAAKKMKYEDLFPVEAKKFGYQLKDEKQQKKKVFMSVEEALDDRVKKKADRYCK